MSYKQTKLLSFLIVLSICLVFNLVLIKTDLKNDSSLLLESLIPIIFITILITLFIWIFVWGIWRVCYAESFLNNLSLTDKDIKTIWMGSRRYTYFKDMDKTTLESKTKVLIEFSSDRLKHCKEDDIRNIAIACICINYSLLWKGGSKGNNKDIISVFKRYHDYIKLVYRFKDTI